MLYIGKGETIVKNLARIRKLADVSLKNMSNLLNESAYVYNAYETGRLPIPLEIIKMISMIYEVDKSILTDDSLPLDQETENRLTALSKMTGNERYIHLYSHILEEGQVPNYRNIKRVKERICESLLCEQQTSRVIK